MNIVSIPLEQGNVFRRIAVVLFADTKASQSLWNRAMSSDLERVVDNANFKACLNPFGTGQCLPTVKDKVNYKDPVLSQSLWNRAMSSDHLLLRSYYVKICLNPFGTGQCLPTSRMERTLAKRLRLNPFGTGQCLPTINQRPINWSRGSLNPFGTGQCLPTKQ